MTGATIGSSPMIQPETPLTLPSRCYKRVSVCALLTWSNPTRRSTKKENAAFCRISALRHHLSIHPDSYYDKGAAEQRQCLPAQHFNSANAQSDRIQPAQPFPNQTDKIIMTGNREKEMSAMTTNKKWSRTRFCREINRQQSHLSGSREGKVSCVGRESRSGSEEGWEGDRWRG